MLIHGKQADHRSGTPVLVDSLGRVVTTPGSGAAETPSAARVSANGTVGAGARSVTFITSQASPPLGNGVDFSGSILGVARGPGESLTIAAQPGNTLTAIAYTVAAGSLDIVKTV